LAAGERIEATATTQLAGFLLGVETEFNITEELDALLGNYACVLMYVVKVLDIAVQKQYELLKNFFLNVPIYLQSVYIH
jgi:hypothetical protein